MAKKWDIEQAEYGDGHLIGEGGGYVAKVWEKSDAGLIAAAPDMLDALETISSLCALYAPKEGDGLVRNALIEMLSKSNKAIAKAKGGAA